MAEHGQGASEVGSAVLESASTARAEANRRRRRARRRRGTIGSYVLLALGALIVLFPLYVLLADSLMSPTQIASNPPNIFPTDPQWSNYRLVFTQYGFGRYFWNSTVQTSVIVAFQLVTSVLAGYAFVFLRFPLRNTLFFAVLATLMIPLEITASTNLSTMQDMGWTTSYVGLTVPFLATGFGIFLMRQAFLQIPKDLREAAVIDGYGPMAFLWRVAIPLTRPVIAALAVFSFLGAWNQYLWPSIISSNAGPATISVGLHSLGSADTLGVSLAAGVVALLPLALLLLFFRKNLIRSLQAGAVK